MKDDQLELGSSVVLTLKKSALRAVLCLRDVNLFYVAALDQTFVKHFVNVNIILVFAENDVIVFQVQK